MAIKLETDRLTLRTLSPDDAEPLVKAIGHPDIAATTLNIPHPYTLEAANTWIERVNDLDVQEKYVDVAVFIRESNELVGGIGLMAVSKRHRNAELGYWCAVEYWGKGITTEAALRILKYAFEELDLERVWAICFVGNPASVRVMEKIGMQFEGTARHEYKKGDGFIDNHHYAILRDEWEGLRT